MRKALFLTGALLMFTTIVACSDDATGTSGGTSGSSGSSGGTSGSSGGTSGGSSGSTGSTSSSSFTCSLNGSCYVCPSGEAVRKCALDGPTGSGCSSADSSKCEK